MPENAQIDDDLFDKINEAMLIRLKDKFSNVRIQAVLALSRLQDPKDENCPVVNSKYYCFFHCFRVFVDLHYFKAFFKHRVNKS